MIGNRLFITFASFLALGCVGMTFAFFGASLPALRSLLELNLAQAGMLAACLQVAFAVISFVGGLLSDLTSRDKVVLAGCAFLGGGVILLGAFKPYPINLATAFCMGIGAGLIVTGSNALVAALYPDRQGSVLNLLHVFFGIGSFAGPLIMGRLLTNGTLWLSGYDSLGVFLLALAGLFVLTRLPSSRKLGRKDMGREIARLMVQPQYIGVLVVSMMTIGAQFGIMFLAVTFMIESKGISVVHAGIVLSAFFALMVVGRLVCSRLARRMSNTAITFRLLILLLVTLVAAWLGGGWWSAAAFALSGFACSGTFPCLLALIGIVYFDVAGTAMGVLSAFNGFGGMIVCGLTGVLAQSFGMQVGFSVVVAASVIALALFASRLGDLSQAESSGVRNLERRMSER